MSSETEPKEVIFIFDSSGEIISVEESSMIGGIIYNIYDYEDAISFDRHGNVTAVLESGGLTFVTKEAARNNFDTMADVWCPSYFGFKSVDYCDNNTCQKCWNVALRS